MCCFVLKGDTNRALKRLKKSVASCCPERQNPKPAPVHWEKLDGYMSAYALQTSWLIGCMLICGFCGRASLGGTPTAENRFHFLPAHGPPPYASANIPMYEYMGRFTER